MNVKQMYQELTDRGESIEFTVVWCGTTENIFPGNHFYDFKNHKRNGEPVVIRVYEFGDGMNELREPTDKEMEYIMDNLDDVIFMSFEDPLCSQGSTLFI